MFILYVLEMRMTIYNVFPKKYIAIIIMLLAAVMPTEAADIITCSEKVQNGMWVCFRKTFELAEAPSENTLRISADSKYRLYVNGEIVVREGQLKRGPNPHDSYIDSLGIKNLRKGKNTVPCLCGISAKAVTAIAVLLMQDCISTFPEKLSVSAPTVPGNRVCILLITFPQVRNPMPVLPNRT